MKVDFDFKIDIVPYENNNALLNKEIKRTALKLNS